MTTENPPEGAHFWNSPCVLLGVGSHSEAYWKEILSWENYK